MSRRDEFKNNNPNPAIAFLEWKSDKQCFQFWDKETQDNIEVKIPFKFLFLMELHTVKGYHNESESGIYSNEVKKISEQEMHVKSFKGGTIAKGLYKDIKDRLHGGHYVKSIYAMNQNGQIINFQIKGSVVHQWGEFTKANWKRMQDEWVEAYDIDKRKNGAISYTVPMFRLNTSLSDKEDEMAENAYSILKEYMDGYLMNKSEKEAVEQLYNDAKEDAEILQPETADNIFPDDAENNLPF